LGRPAGRSCAPVPCCAAANRDFSAARGEVAGFALGNFLAGCIGGYFAEGGGGLGEITGRQPGGDLGIFQRGGGDEVAVVADDGDGAVWFMVHNSVSL